VFKNAARPIKVIWRTSAEVEKASTVADFGEGSDDVVIY